jgi:dihydrodipicolinate synthase/N-acetylneuraminate lyase
MATGAMRGVFPILITPFDGAGRIDEESLRRLVEFNVQAGVHGLGVALGSEIFKFSEAERGLVTRVVVDQVRGRIPVVINTGAASTSLAVLYSQTAQEQGADALMIMPPSFIPVGPTEAREYFRAISDAVTIPIFIQDTATTPVPAGLARQMAEESRWVRYIKVESIPPAAKVADAVAQAGDILTIFGGAGGGYFIEEMRRGSVGTMPFCSQPEAFVEVWDHFQSGDQAGARATFDRVIAPINRVSAQATGAYYHVNKELLRQRGIIATAHVRHPSGPPLDDLTRRELQAIIDELYGAGASA